MSNTITTKTTRINQTQIRSANSTLPPQNIHYILKQTLIRDFPKAENPSSPGTSLISRTRAAGSLLRRRMGGGEEGKNLHPRRLSTRVTRATGNFFRQLLPRKSFRRSRAKKSWAGMRARVKVWILCGISAYIIIIIVPGIGIDFVGLGIPVRIVRWVHARGEN